MGDISIKGKSPILRQGYKKGGTVKVRDINKDGKKEGWEVARAKGTVSYTHLTLPTILLV